MTAGTELERRPPARDVALFAGAGADEILATATDVANKFSDVVKQRRMFKRIGDNDHIQIEAWQTIGALTGVLADEGHVTELPWPTLEALGEEPPYPEGREPRDKDTPAWRQWSDVDKTRRAWELHRDMLRARAVGRAFGFKAEFRAAKAGLGVGWGEGRCTRGEPSKVAQEDYALASMAQTRGQSRALGAPLKFVVKLAGYETTSAEELDGATGSSDPAAPGAPAAPWGPIANDELEAKAAAAVKAIRPGINGEQFVLAIGQNFDGVPEAVAIALRGLAKFIAAFDGKAGAGAGGADEQAPPERSESAYHTHPTADGDPGGRRYHGD